MYQLDSKAFVNKRLLHKEGEFIHTNLWIHIFFQQNAQSISFWLFWICHQHIAVLYSHLLSTKCTKNLVVLNVPSGKANALRLVTLGRINKLASDMTRSHRVAYDTSILVKVNFPNMMMHSIPQSSKICEDIFCLEHIKPWYIKTNTTPIHTFWGNFCLNVSHVSKRKEKMVSRPRCEAQSVMMDPLYEW